MSSHRMERVNRELLRVLGGWLRENFETNDLVTLTGASLTRDLSQAKISVQATQNLDHHLEDLNRLSRRIKSEVKKQLHWKTIPNLEFKADLANDTITKVEEILDEL